MQFVKEYWEERDIEEFEKYLISIKNEAKIKWIQNIIQTNKAVHAIKTNVLRNISKEILKGNYESFLNYMLSNFHEEIIINALIINKIQDFKVKEKYLIKYLKIIDNWAACDSLKFKENERNLELSKKFVKNANNFTRRVGVIILFAFITDKNIENVFENLKILESEEDYYVKMAMAWLLCECYIKKPEETMNFIKNNKLNAFVMNKMISKCQDSYRITKEEKEKLKEYRIK